MAADRIGTKPTFWFCLTIQLATLLAIIAGPSLAVLDVLLFWLGLSAAGSDTTLVKGAVETFGVRAIGAVMGVLEPRAGAAAPRWARPRPASSTTRWAPTCSRSRWPRAGSR